MGMSENELIAKLLFDKLDKIVNGDKFLEEITNDEILNNHYSQYISIASKSSRKSNLKRLTTFLENKHLLTIKKRDLIDFFNFLNQHPDLAENTKLTTWNMTRALTHFVNDYYEEYLDKAIVIPKVHWSKIHKESGSNKDVIATPEELEQINNYFLERSEKMYWLVRVLEETGMRIGESINIEVEKICFDEQLIKTHGKMGRKEYIMSKDLVEGLKMYLAIRLEENEFLFPNNRGNKFKYTTSLAREFGKAIKELKIEQNITPHTLRRTLNTMRKDMGCDHMVRCRLINHKITNVNENAYTKYSPKQLLELYNKWYPYHNIKL